jgi:hypothetical protein
VECRTQMGAVLWRSRCSVQAGSAHPRQRTRDIMSEESLRKQGQQRKTMRSRESVGGLRAAAASLRPHGPPSCPDRSVRRHAVQRSMAAASADDLVIPDALRARIYFSEREGDLPRPSNLAALACPSWGGVPGGLLIYRGPERGEDQAGPLPAGGGRNRGRAEEN